MSQESGKWGGDYTLNYNFESPYYGVFASNHLELAASYFDAILEYIPEGRLEAAAYNCSGVHYPGHIGPFGLRCSNDMVPFLA